MSLIQIFKVCLRLIKEKLDLNLLWLGCRAREGFLKVQKVSRKIVVKISLNHSKYHQVRLDICHGLSQSISRKTICSKVHHVNISEYICLSYKIHNLILILIILKKRRPTKKNT